jgi:hypothetical protein
MTLLVGILCCILGTAQGDLIGLLPGDGIPAGWVAAGEPVLFEGQALYRHINGGAELYHDHGFIALAMRDYHKESLEVRAEIYDMGSPEGAAGVFDANTKGLETDKTYGTASSVDDYQILFHRDRYYVSLTCYTATPEEGEAMAALARAIQGKIDN